MKKIIASSIILLGACLVSTTASAQLASDQPSQSAQKTVTATSARVMEVQTASSAPAPTTITATPAKVVDVQTASSTAVIPAVPTQGTEKAAPVVVAVPAPQAKMQSNTTPAAKKAVDQ